MLQPDGLIAAVVSGGFAAVLLGWISDQFIRPSWIMNHVNDAGLYDQMYLKFLLVGIVTMFLAQLFMTVGLKKRLANSGHKD